MIPRSKVYLRKRGSSLQLVQQVIDSWQWVLVLNGDFVELSIIYAHLKRAILLFDKEDRSSPWRETRSNETFV